MIDFFNPLRKRVFLVVECNNCGKTKKRLINKNNKKLIKYCSKKCYREYSYKRSEQRRLNAAKKLV